VRKLDFKGEKKMQTVILKGKDFSTIHNALCDLRLVSDRVSDDVAREINPIIQKIEEGLRDAYDQDNSQFNNKHDHYRDVQFKNGFESVWSIYELSDLYLPHGYGEDLVVEYNGYTEPVEGNTWVDLWRAADKLIFETDHHHIFIEAFVKKGSKLQLITGS
jgi:hypothetical protein